MRVSSDKGLSQLLAKPKLRTLWIIIYGNQTLMHELNSPSLMSLCKKCKLSVSRASQVCLTTLSCYMRFVIVIHLNSQHHFHMICNKAAGWRWQYVGVLWHDQSRTCLNLKPLRNFIQHTLSWWAPSSAGWGSTHHWLLRWVSIVTVPCHPWGLESHLHPHSQSALYTNDQTKHTLAHTHSKVNSHQSTLQCLLSASLQLSTTYLLH